MAHKNRDDLQRVERQKDFGHWVKGKCRRAFELYRQLKKEGLLFEAENMLQLLELLHKEPRPAAETPPNTSCPSTGSYQQAVPNPANQKFNNYWQLSNQCEARMAKSTKSILSLWLISHPSHHWPTQQRSSHCRACLAIRNILYAFEPH